MRTGNNHFDLFLIDAHLLLDAHDMIPDEEGIADAVLLVEKLVSDDRILQEDEQLAIAAQVDQEDDEPSSLDGRWSTEQDCVIDSLILGRVGADDSHESFLGFTGNYVGIPTSRRRKDRLYSCLGYRVG